MGERETRFPRKSGAPADGTPVVTTSVAVDAPVAPAMDPVGVPENNRRVRTGLRSTWRILRLRRRQTGYFRQGPGDPFVKQPRVFSIS